MTCSSLTWYSGSSEPTIRLDQSNSLNRSSRGTPSSSAITSNGSSAAMSTTKSQSPSLASASSMMRTVSSRTCGSRAAIIRGVNPRFTSLRYRVWPGGSMNSIMLPAISVPGSGAIGPSSITTPPSSCAEEKVAASRLQVTMSS